MSPEQRLVQLGIELPTSSPPAGNYAAAIRSGTLLFLSGKAPLPVGGVKLDGLAMHRQVFVLLSGQK
jgi:hypothetical protein